MEILSRQLLFLAAIAVTLTGEYGLDLWRNGRRGVLWRVCICMFVATYSAASIIILVHCTQCVRRWRKFRGRAMRRRTAETAFAHLRNAPGARSSR